MLYMTDEAEMEWLIMEVTQSQVVERSSVTNGMRWESEENSNKSNHTHTPHTHTHLHVRTHTHIPTNTHASTHVHTHTHVCMHRHTHTKYQAPCTPTCADALPAAMAPHTPRGKPKARSTAAEAVASWGFITVEGTPLSSRMLASFTTCSVACEGEDVCVCMCVCVCIFLCVCIHVRLSVLCLWIWHQTPP
jgi:hypothetical protein